MPTHVDDYQPPTGPSIPTGFNPPPAPVAPAAPAVDPSANLTPPNSTSSFSQAFASVATKPAAAPVDNFQDQPLTAYERAMFEDTQPGDGQDATGASQVAAAVVNPAAPATSASSSTPQSNQSLEAQNIFDLLGVSDGKPEEKDAFLDELQDVIWEDFLANDTQALLTEPELAQLQELKAKGNTPQVQEEILVFLEKLIPDLEDMMMDKAIELKEDMVMERIAGLREFHAQNAPALEKITEAEKLISQNRWADASQLLNSIK